MPAQSEEEPDLGGKGEGEGTGKHDVMTTLKSSVIWLVVIFAILAAFSWFAIEFEFLPKAPVK